MTGRKAHIRMVNWLGKSPIDNRSARRKAAPTRAKTSGCETRDDIMDMHHLRYLLAVCDTLNFTRAAEKCNVTQPALSRAIQQLEEEVGGQLFRRERSLTHLTDLGMLM